MKKKLCVGIAYDVKRIIAFLQKVFLTVILVCYLKLR